MLDIGWTELLVIGALALIVVGPRDLPHLLRTVGQTVGKIKRMAREFQRSMEDAARETDLANFDELRDLKKEMGSFDFRQQVDRTRSSPASASQPVRPDGKPAQTAAGRSSAAAAESAAAGISAEKATAPGTPAAAVEPEERRPAGVPDPGATTDGPEPRQAGAKG